MIRVGIVDDEPLIRDGFRVILGSRPGFQVVCEAADGDEAVTAVQAHAPDVVLMDVRMPRMDGIEATTRIVAQQLPTRVLMLTTFDRDEYVYVALRAGASGFLLKSAPTERLIDAIRKVAAGEALLAPEITRRLIEDFVRRPPPSPEHDQALAALTDREREVLVQVARGRSNSETARELFLSEATVKTYLTRVLSKLQLRDRAQAVVFAYEHGLVHPGR